MIAETQREIRAAHIAQAMFEARDRQFTRLPANRHGHKSARYAIATISPERIVSFDRKAGIAERCRGFCEKLGTRLNLAALSENLRTVVGRVTCGGFGSRGAEVDRFHR
jgi:hypothetical protein